MLTIAIPQQMPNPHFLKDAYGRPNIGYSQTGTTGGTAPYTWSLGGSGVVHNGGGSQLAVYRPKPCTDKKTAKLIFDCLLDADDALLKKLENVSDCDVDRAVREWYLSVNGSRLKPRAACRLW